MRTSAAMWAELRKHLDVEHPTNLDGSVYLGVTQHDVPPDMDIDVAKLIVYASLFKQQDDVNASSKPRSGNDELPVLGQPAPAGIMSTIPSPLMGVISYLPFTKTSASMPSSYVGEVIGHAEQCVVIYCELTGNNTTQLTNVATHCIDDHHVSRSGFTEKGVLASSAERIVLKCLNLALHGRPDIRWSDNEFAR